MADEDEEEVPVAIERLVGKPEDYEVTPPEDEDE